MRKRAIAAGVAALIALACGLWLTRDRDPAPAERPQRTLKLTLARLAADASQLDVQGTTNLPDGAHLTLLVLHGSSELVRGEATVQEGAFSWSQPAQGALSAGSYTASVRFALADQSEAIARALDYQPRSLSDQTRFSVTLPVDAPAADTPQARVLTLVERVSQAMEPSALSELDREAQALDKTLWIARERGALKTLRLAISEAQKSTPDRAAFEKLLLEAHALASAKN